MKQSLGIFVAGANGRMGKNIIRLVIDDQDLRLAGATENPSSPVQGADAGLNAGSQVVSVTIASDLERPLQQYKGVIIDFSSPETTLNNIQRAVEAKTPIVIGTTGFTEEQRATIKEAAKKTPIVLAPNMSVGMNLLFNLIAQAGKVLKDDYDIEILEAHHHSKKDSPSGTANKIARVLCESTERDFPEDIVYERHSSNEVRTKKEIGMQTIRGGDIVGEHTVFFCGEGERVEVKHVASRRTTFARGALRAAKWIANQKPGLYDMKHVLDLKGS